MYKIKIFRLHHGKYIIRNSSKSNLYTRINTFQKDCVRHFQIGNQVVLILKKRSKGTTTVVQDASTRPSWRPGACVCTIDKAHSKDARICVCVFAQINVYNMYNCILYKCKRISSNECTHDGD